MPALSPAQFAALQAIADTAHDPNRDFWTPDFRAGRRDARARLGQVLSDEGGDFESAAIAMDAESWLHEGDYESGWLSILDEVRGVLPSWPWLPEGALLDTLNGKEPIA